MLPLNKTQKGLLAEKLSDVANLAAGGMIVGQFIGERSFSVPLALFGMGIWLVITVCAVRLAGRIET